ncbi:MAG TPA: hypothetical protein DD444_23120 [Citreicella sp.]|jgi:hypothetical protein|nr:hypothetical protein [Citreicella sp.]HBS99717.1 hypothetical protein [Citreicella sp.]|tara:strand:+ start:95 stop:460 length:366 start_codon:yes stop_codon:yes gene_type:complete
MHRRLFTIVLLTSLTAAAISFLALAPHHGVQSRYRMLAHLEHVLAFGLLMVPAALLRPHWLHWLWPMGIAFAGVIELLQPQFGRRADLMHWVSSSFGIVLITFGTWLALSIVDLIRHRNGP